MKNRTNMRNCLQCHYILYFPLHLADNSIYVSLWQGPLILIQKKMPRVSKLLRCVRDWEAIWKFLTSPAVIAVMTDMSGVPSAYTFILWSKHKSKDNPPEGIPLILQANNLCFDLWNAYPELSQGVDMLSFQKSIVIAVHQTFTMHYSCIVH